MAAGERGLLSRPADSARFRENVEVAVGFAAANGCRASTPSTATATRGREAAQRELAVENLVLRRRCRRPGGRATVVIEALNAFDNPDYPITTSGDALALVDRLRFGHGVPNVAFLADLYHLARMAEPIGELVTARGSRFGHVQIADSPGRGQPGTGELDLPGVLRRLSYSGYDGWVGLEYRPVGPSADSFGWLPRELRASGVVVR